MAETDASAEKAWAARIFTATSAAHARNAMFAHFGERLVEWAGLEAGEHVLDVGAGTGASLLPATRRLGARGRITAVDLAPGMVEQLNASIQRERLRNATALVADGEALPFPDQTFDAVVCGFTLFFFPDPQRALGEIRRVLRPGGRVALSTFTRRGSASMDGIWSLIGRHVVVPPSSSGPRFDDREELRQALLAADFVEIEIAEAPYEVSLPGIDVWIGWVRSMEFREYLDKMDEQTLRRFRQDARAVISRHSDTARVCFAMDAYLTRARRPKAARRMCTSPYR